jgi:predicted phage-related endonuclease
MSLTSEQIAFRKTVLGGSDANILMSGDNEKIFRLWQEKRGEKEHEDLSDVLPVQMGIWTEAFNRTWFTKTTGRNVLASGDQRICLDHPFMGCTLDGLTDGGDAVWEAKHVSAFWKDEEVIQKYIPQLTHNMIVCDVKKAVLSVFFGNHKHSVFEFELDLGYAEELIAVEEQFWDCVLEGMEPVIRAVKYDGPVDKKVDMTGNNEWADLAATFSANKEAAGKFDKAKEGIKKLVPDDAVEAFGHGISAKRSKTGSLTIKETK